MNRTLLAALAMILCGSAALTHTGVKNAAVQARMHGMSMISENVKTLGTIAKGQAAFEAMTARAAAAAIADHAAQSVDLFAANETDPKSEALPVIWENFDDFTAKAQALQAVASELSASITSVEDVRAAVQSIGATCTACHTRYRE